MNPRLIDFVQRLRQLERAIQREHETAARGPSPQSIAPDPAVILVVAQATAGTPTDGRLPG